MSVKRYRPYYFDPIKLIGHAATMRENLEGDYVLYADYDAQTSILSQQGSLLVELSKQNEMLRKRCYPSKVVAIEGKGHYVSEAVAAHLKSMEAVLDKAYRMLALCFSRIHCLPRTTDTVLAHNIEHLRAEIQSAVTRSGTAPSENVKTQDQPRPDISLPYPWCRQPSACRGTCPMDPNCGE